MERELQDPTESVDAEAAIEQALKELEDTEVRAKAEAAIEEFTAFQKK